MRASVIVTAKNARKAAARGAQHILEKDGNEEFVSGLPKR